MSTPETAFRISDLAREIAAADKSTGHEVRALLEVALAVSSYNGTQAAAMLMSAAVVAGHASEVSLDDMEEVLQDGYDVCVENEMRSAAS